MNLIDECLRTAVSDYDTQWTQDEKIERFHHLYIDLERRYTAKLDDVRRLEIEHKAELAEVLFLLNI